MLYELPSVCPVCSGGFHVQRLGCEKCGCTLEGGFKLDRLSRLPVEMRDFIVIFVQSRGNIREMEKYYNISYPTVRARLDEIVSLLDSQETGDKVKNSVDTDGAGAEPSRLEVLQMLARGEIDANKARELIENGGGL